MAQSSLARKAGILVAGTGIYVATTGLVYLWVTAGREDQCEHERKKLSKGGKDFSYVTNPSRRDQFDTIAAKYDYEISSEERVMGLNVFRRQLLYWHAKGTVLEVAAGTARNVSFYPSSVDRVILTDASPQMLHQARKKVADFQRDNDPESAWFPRKEIPKFAILQADGSNLVDFDDNTFDTVVDTFGLCSFDDPIAVLKEMERVCKPDGKILLLEHGRSKNWSFITQYLDKTAERHAKEWGCVYNRDLDLMIEQSGLQLDRLITWHFGTTYYMICRPNKTS